MDKNLSHVELIREVFHYQSRFDGSTMVFKIDFPVTEHPLFPSMVKDLALLSRTGFKIVIVPGAKEFIDYILKENKIIPEFNGSVRVTGGEAMPFVEMAAFHSTARFMTGFSGSRVEAVIGNFVRARGLGVINGKDMKHSGTVDKFYADSLRRVLELGMVPILPCIGWSPSGKPYNVPSDEIALSAAINIKAAKLFIISLSGGIKKEHYNIPGGIETSETGRIIRLTPLEAEKVLEANASKEDKALSELSLALKACKGGVERVQVIDGGEEGAILKELFSNLGAGTMIYSDKYEAIRGIKNSDIPDILRLMEPLMQKGILLRRQSEDIQNKKEDYAVYVIDEKINACGALHDWGEGQGEIAAIATDPGYANMGLGRHIVGYLIEKAKKSGLKRVFVSTISTHDWFEALGFHEAKIETLPEKKRILYDTNRNSKVFALDL